MQRVYRVSIPPYGGPELAPVIRCATTRLSSAQTSRRFPRSQPVTTLYRASHRVLPKAACQAFVPTQARLLFGTALRLYPHVAPLPLTLLVSIAALFPFHRLSITVSSHCCNYRILFSTFLSHASFRCLVIVHVHDTYLTGFHAL